MTDPSALIVGAGGGIGRDAAVALAQAGMRLVLGDRDAEALRETATLLPAPALACLPVDVADDASVTSMVTDGVRLLGPIDVLCTTAGIFGGPERPLEETDMDTARRVVDVNLLGAVRLLRAAAPHLRDGASVVLTGSTSGLIAHPGAALYGATKIALVGLARSAAAELAPRGIRVNVVCPGGVRTEFARAAYAGRADEVFSEYARRNPLGRVGEPADVADVIAFLASPASRHITGVALRVDGGDGLDGVL